MTRAPFLLGLLLMMIGCEFVPAAPADVRLTCASDADCPDGFACSRQGCLSAGIEIPVMEPSSHTTSEDQAVTLVLVARGVERPVFRVVEAPRLGVVDCDESCDGAPEYTPNRDANGRDTITLLVENPDVIGGDNKPVRSDPVVITIDIVPDNDAPIFAQDAELVTNEDEPSAVNLLALVTDVDFDPLTFVVEIGAEHGTVSIADATALYAPSRDYAGPDTFRVRASDGVSETVADVLVAVAPVNDAPVLEPLSVLVREDIDEAIVIPSFDAEGDPLTFILLSVPARGNVSFSGLPDGASLLYEPLQFGPDELIVVAEDPAGARSEQVTVSIDIQPLLAANDVSETVPEDGAVEFEIAGVGPALLSFSLELPGNGVVVFAGAPVFDGFETRVRVEYRPAPDFAGTDSFLFRVADGAGAADLPGTATILVSAVDDEPVAPSFTRVVDEDESVPIVLAPTDIDSINLTIEAEQLPGWTRVGDPASPAGFVDTPPANFSGVALIEYSVADATTEVRGLVTVVVSEVPDAPEPQVSSPIAAIEDTRVVIVIGAFDGDGEDVDFDLTLPAGWSFVSENGEQGVFEVNPPANFFGPASITYGATDETGVRAEGAIIVNVAAVNDDPQVDTLTFGAPAHDVETTITPTITDEDVADTAFSLVVVAQPAHGTLLAAGPGSLLYRRNGLSAFLDDTAVIRARDSSGGESDDTLITIELESRSSCALIKNSGESLGDTIHVIDPAPPGGTDRYLAFCDMTTAGGGWTLALRVDGRSAASAFFDPGWTSVATQNDNVAGRDVLLGGRLKSFFDPSMPVDEMLVGFAPIVGVGGQATLAPFHFIRAAVDPAAAGVPLRDLFVGGSVPLATVPEDAVEGTTARERWQSLSPGNLEPACNLEALNNTSSSVQLRIGLLADAAGCSSAGSFIGVGASAGPAVGRRNLVPAESQTMFAVVLVRSRDLTELQPRATCFAHKQAGANLDGFYRLSTSIQFCEHGFAQSICADGFLDAEEECDDAEFIDGDGCDAACLLETCGNHRLEGLEECDDGGTGCCPPSGVTGGGQNCTACAFATNYGGF